MGLNQSTGNCLKDIQNLPIGFLAFIGMPVFVVVTIGNYVGYRQITWLHSVRKKSIVRKNDLLYYAKQ